MRCISRKKSIKILHQIPPENERITVLIHGAACLDNMMFSYDPLSGRPNEVSYLATEDVQCQQTEVTNK